jgi:uncharacterized protein (TIGR02145 family)
MKSLQFKGLTVALFFISLFLGSAAHSQTISAGASYFPLKDGATYYYRVTMNGAEKVDGIQIIETTTARGDKIFYFENIINPSTIIGVNTFGMGAFCIEKNEVYTIEAFWKDDLTKINHSEKQLLIPKKIETGQHIQLIPSGSDPVYTFTFEGYDNLTVPAGEFRNCLKYRMVARWKSGSENTDYIWLAEDIGMIKYHRSTGRIEELIEHSGKKQNVLPTLATPSAATAPVQQVVQKPVEQVLVPAQEQAQQQATVTDFEGNTYKTVKIGSQVWMADNLKSTKYSDGTPIVDSLAANNEYLKEIPTFGRLYSWHALLRGKTLDGSQGVCPTGWHVPMKSEWETLIQFAGGADIAGQKLKSKGTQHFKSPNTGTDAYDFNALPSGIHTPEIDFSGAWHRAHFWTSTIDNQFASPGEYCVGFFYEIWHDTDKVDEMFNMPGNYHPVRCIKD